MHHSRKPSCNEDQSDMYGFESVVVFTKSPTENASFTQPHTLEYRVLCLPQIDGTTLSLSTDRPWLFISTRIQTGWQSHEGFASSQLPELPELVAAPRWDDHLELGSETIL
ncbi:hypothetical protein ABKN59_010639 [Abortiporus biennis]